MGTRRRRPQPENPAQQRLALLVRAGEIFHQSLEVNETLDNVARLAVESFADLCLFDLLDERSERLFVTAFAHRDRTKEPALANVSTLLHIEEFRVHPVVEVTRTGKPFFVPHMDETNLRQHAASLRHERYMREFGYRSKIVVPVTAQGQIFGALTFVRTGDNKLFDEDDLVFAIELGRRAGLAVANAKQFHRERNVAETLQRAFLPSRLPSRNGLEVSAHYRPGSSEADIGGDWYDAFETSDGSIVLTIGDVTGKGIDAARLMVLLRQAIRIAALEFRDAPHIANVCNRLLLSEQGGKLASAFIGILNPDTRELGYVSAGHPPPFLRLPGNEVRRLDSPAEPLGVLPNVRYRAHTITIPGDAMLVMYTDGVIEAGRDVLAGEEMLLRVLSSNALSHSPNPAAFIERAIAHQEARDDIAIMVVKFGSSEVRWQFEASDARAAYSIRDQFCQTICELCGVDQEQLSKCALIFAELIANIVRHAPGPLSVSVELVGHKVVLHVIDKGPGFAYEPSLPGDLWSENGRGLFLVSRLARAVEVEKVPGLGSHVAVTLPICARGSRAKPLVESTDSNLSRNFTDWRRLAADTI
jgi:serine phosphatase RsbU (regulator of sigma subunit)/anti-sigma regulatory factor (Ser/Thr protein kinase)